jgi:hypothetical protein
MKNLHKIRNNYSDLIKAMIYAVQRYNSKSYVVHEVIEPDTVVWYSGGDYDTPLDWTPYNEAQIKNALDTWIEAGRPEPRKDLFV